MASSSRSAASSSSSSASSPRSTPAAPSLPRSGSRRAAPATSPADEASHKAMRLLKRMKPNQLQALSEAAATMQKEKLAKLEQEKTRRENKKKVAEFVAKNDNFVDLVGDCYVCLEPLLNNIGTTKFGVASWKCRCTVPQKSHTGCLFSKICRERDGQANCDMCDSPIMFETALPGGRSKATVRFRQDDEERETQREREESSEEDEESESDDDSSRNSDGE